MNFEEMKKFYVGKKLLTIITLDAKEPIISVIKKMTESEHYDNIDSLQLLLFEDNKALVFVDFDSDGYRSGNWYVLHLENLLDKGATKGIKEINSKVFDIEYCKGKNWDSSSDSDCDFILITTEAYLIAMGQKYVHDYYPSNFFDIKECRDFILGKGEIVKMPEETKNGTN